MKRRILDNLNRQNSALGLLATLLGEEFSHLREGDPQAVSAIELSIQELLRQLSGERLNLKAMVQTASPDGARLEIYCQSLPKDEQEAFAELLAEIDGREQNCAVLSAKNFELAMALHEQSRSLLTFLHKQINPEHKDTYTAQGKFPKVRRGAAILHGRL